MKPGCSECERLRAEYRAGANLSALLVEIALHEAEVHTKRAQRLQLAPESKGKDGR